MRPERPRDLGVDELGDAELVARIASGEEASFAIAFERHSSLLFGSVVRFLGDREAAADVVQETYLALWRRATQFNAQSGSLAAWLLGIARNRAIDRLRAEARRPPLASPSPPSGGADGGRDDRDPLDRRSPATEAGDPATIAGRRWVQSVVRTSVAELGEPERDVLRLAYTEGLSQSEIAARLGWPLGTVKSRSRRAMAHLRTRLAAVPDLMDEPDRLGGRGATTSGRTER